MGYTQEETETLLSCIDEVVPIGPQEWENALHKHQALFPDTDRDVASIRRKFNKLQSTRIPTGDPNCPPLVRQAKRIQRNIEEKMDAQEELEEEELGFPSSDVDCDGNMDPNVAASPAVAAAATTTTGRTVIESSLNSPALFRHPKKPRVDPHAQSQAISSKVDGLLSVLVTKMVQDQDRAEELRLERQQARDDLRREREERERQNRNETRRNDMMTMMMMSMMSTIVPPQVRASMNQMLEETTEETKEENTQEENTQEGNTQEGNTQEDNTPEVTQNKTT